MGQRAVGRSDQRSAPRRRGHGSVSQYERRIDVDGDQRAHPWRELHHARGQSRDCLGAELRRHHGQDGVSWKRRRRLQGGRHHDGDDQLRLDEPEQRPRGHAVLQRGDQRCDRLDCGRHTGQRNSSDTGLGDDVVVGGRQRRRVRGARSGQHELLLRLGCTNAKSASATPTTERLPIPPTSMATGATTRGAPARAAHWGLSARTIWVSHANFIAPVVLDPNNPNRLLVGADHLFVTSDPRTEVGRAHHAHGQRAFVGHDQAVNGSIHQRRGRVADELRHHRGRAQRRRGVRHHQRHQRLADLDESRRATRRRFPTAWSPASRSPQRAPNTLWVTFGGYNAQNIWKSTDLGGGWSADQRPRHDGAAVRADLRSEDPLDQRALALCRHGNRAVYQRRRRRDTGRFRSRDRPT